MLIRNPEYADHRRKILIIDDLERILRMVTSWIEGAGYLVLTAQDGRTGIEMAVAEQPDLVIVDLIMPGMDGCEVARALQADLRTRAIPLLLMTVPMSGAMQDWGRQGGRFLVEMNSAGRSANSGVVSAPPSSQE